jgi:catechol 2,3-dioxygenase-like lactoylglutathione lyase family enzyme
VSGGVDEEVPTAPELFVSDVEATVRFWVERLGAERVRLEPGSFGVVRLEASIVFVAHESHYAQMGGGTLDGRRGVGLDVRIVVADVDAVHRRARAANVEIVHDIADRDYGLRNFIVRDPNGFRIRFASPLRARA